MQRALVLEFPNCQNAKPRFWENAGNQALELILRLENGLGSEIAWLLIAS